MIQRIQTLFLLCALVLTGLLYFLPIANITLDGTQCLYFVSKMVENNKAHNFIQWNTMTLIANSIIMLFTFTSIFLYKKKFLSLQIRLSIVNSILNLGLIALIWIQTKNIDMTWKFELASVFPLVNFILIWIAIRNILKDYKVLKSLDRIR